MTTLGNRLRPQRKLRQEGTYHGGHYNETESDIKTETSPQSRWKGIRNFISSITLAHLVLFGFLILLIFLSLVFALVHYPGVLGTLKGMWLLLFTLGLVTCGTILWRLILDTFNNA